MSVNAIIGLVALMTSSLVLAGSIPYGASAINHRDLPHPRGDLVFTGTVGGHAVTLTGEVQSILAQVQALHPEFDPESLLLVNDTNTDEIVAREANNKNGIICHPVPGQNWDWAYRPAINSGISYLQGLNGGCHVPATTCVRISCSYNAAIYLCNDNNYAIQPSCIYLASYAVDIENQPNCQLNLPNSGGYVCGQEFDSDRYNIIVRFDSC